MTGPLDPNADPNADPHVHPNVDLHPAAERVRELLASTGEADLLRPTPCDVPVAALLTHVGGLCAAFAAAARKDLGPATATPPAPSPQLPGDWRTTFPRRLAELADAWADPAAWRGSTQAGGIDLPAAQAGLVALDELVLHGWDLAVATGRRCVPDEASLSAVEAFVGAVPADPAARAGLFGPPLPVPAGASRFERVLALAGRDPAWSSPAA